MVLAKQNKSDGIEGDGLSLDRMGKHRMRSDGLEMKEIKSNPWCVGRYLRSAIHILTSPSRGKEAGSMLWQSMSHTILASQPDAITHWVH